MKGFGESDVWMAKECWGLFRCSSICSCRDVVILGFSACNCHVENFVQEQKIYVKNLLINAMKNQPITWQQQFRLDEDD